MKRYQARYNFRLYPTAEQENYLAQTFGCVRLVYNTLLQHTFDILEERQLQKEQGVSKEELVRFNASSLSSALRPLKEQKPFLKRVSSVVLQQATRQLDTAWKNKARGLAGVPRFKSRHRSKQSATFASNAFSIQDGKLFLGKMDTFLRDEFGIPKNKQSASLIEVRWSRALPSQPKSCTVSKDAAGRYFVSFTVEVTPHRKLCTPLQTVGIDLGLTDFAVLSNGDKIQSPKPLAKALKKLKRLQRSLSRKQKGSQNRDKARQRLARQHARVREIRHDFLHKLSTQLVHENQGIGVESLAIKEMMSDPRLARHIGDASWGSFVRMLEYKSEWYGTQFRKVDRYFASTQLCSTCQHKVGKLELSIRTWTCPCCNTSHDRDVNAAKNVQHAAGLAEWLNACGAESSAPELSGDGSGVSLCAETGIP